MQNYYDVYNEHLFGGQLPDVPVIVVPFSDLEDDLEEMDLGFEIEDSDIYGITFADPNTTEIYGICINEELSQKKETLLHEMIHVWQVQNNLYRGHDKLFYTCIDFLREVLPEMEETLS